MECQQCKGKGYHETILRDLSGRQSHNCGIYAIVPCSHPACQKGKITPESLARYYDVVCGLGKE